MVVAGLAIVNKLDPRTQDEEKKANTIEKLVKIKIGDPKYCRSLKVDKNLQQEIRVALEAFLVENLDVFAWTHSDMVSI